MLSGKERIALRLLRNARKEMYGLDLVGASGGQLGRATIYIVLGRMEENGYITSRKPREWLDFPGLPRSLYKITGRGERILAAIEADNVPQQETPFEAMPIS